MAERLEGKSGSNVSNEVIASFALEADRAQREIDEASGRKRSVLKRAKAAGVNTKALLEALRMKRDDEDRAKLDMRDTIRYTGVIAPSVKLTQTDLFDSLDTRPLNDRMQAQVLEWEAEQNGYAVGLNGGGREECPFDATTPNCLAWYRGWERGQRVIAERMDENAKKADGRLTKRRGGRDKAAGEDVQPDPRQTDIEDQIEA